MFDFKKEGLSYLVELEGGKTVRISAKWVENTEELLNIDTEEVIEMWLTDEGHLDMTDEQAELVEKAKENKVVLKAGGNAVKKEKKTRVAKANPVKEEIIATVAASLEGIAANINVENKGKIITFTIGDDEFKLDLTQKRKNKVS